MLTRNRWKIVAVLLTVITITHVYFEGQPKREAKAQQEMRMQALANIPVTAAQHKAAREAALRSLANM